MKISQSLMKEFKKYYYSAHSSSEKIYEGNNCGLLFKAKFIDKSIIIPPTDSMAEGIFFEYQATGALPKSGIVPLGERTQKGTLTAAYQRATESAVFFKKIIDHYNIKILESAYTIETDLIIGTLDLLVEWDGKPAIIDLKWSGLIDDKWSELGWNTDTLPTKEQLMIQGVHYKLLAREVLGIDDIPFYFWVFDSKDSTNMKIINQEVDEDFYEIHLSDVHKVKYLLEEEIKKGFKALPSYKKCKDCPIKDVCQEKVLFPETIKVYYGANT